MTPARLRPAIDASNRDLERVTAQAWEALLQANQPPHYFLHGNRPVRVASDDSGARVCQELTPDRLRHALARVASWFTPRGGAREPASPPMGVVRDMLASPNPKLPVLERIVAPPILSPMGELHIDPGYDARTRCYYDQPKGFVLPPVPASPSREIEHARVLICDELLGDFSFVGEADKAHAIEALLLPFARELIDGPTPLHLIEKPSPGSGATLLASSIAQIVTGRHAACMTLGRDEEETRKKTTAILRTGPTMVLIDNIRTTLDSAALASAITSRYWEDRILGYSEMSRMPVKLLWLATGNNPRISNEMARRTIPIRLDAKVEKPWLRNSQQFRHPDLPRWISENRPALVWAVLTLIRGWIVAGQPRGGGSLGMFEEWAAVMGGILDVAGIAGFLSNLSDYYTAAEDEWAVWASFVEGWWQLHQDCYVTTGTLYPSAGDIELGSGNERSQKVKLGKALARMRDRRFGNYVIRKGTAYQGFQRWRLEKSP